MPEKAPCPDCGSSAQRECRGQIICQNCCAVLEENVMVVEAQFVQNSFGAVRLAGSSGQSMSSAIQRGAGEVNRIANRLRINQEVRVGARRIYEIAVKNNFNVGRRTKYVAAACVYITCRRMEPPEPILLIDLADIERVPVRTLAKTYRSLIKRLGLIKEKVTTPVLDPSQILEKFAEQLELGVEKHHIKNTAMRLIKFMQRDWISTGRRPNGICGAALLVAAYYHNVRCSPAQIADIVRLSEATLKQRLRELRETPLRNMPPEEIQRKLKEPLMRAESMEDSHHLMAPVVPPCFRKRRGSELPKVNVFNFNDALLAALPAAHTEPASLAALTEPDPSPLAASASSRSPMALQPPIASAAASDPPPLAGQAASSSSAAPASQSAASSSSAAASSSAASSSSSAPVAASSSRADSKSLVDTFATIGVAEDPLTPQKATKLQRLTDQGRMDAEEFRETATEIVTALVPAKESGSVDALCDLFGDESRDPELPIAATQRMDALTQGKPDFADFLAGSPGSDLAVSSKGSRSVHGGLGSAVLKDDREPLSDLSEGELEVYVLDAQEREDKKEMWHEVNKEYLKEWEDRRRQASKRANSTEAGSTTSKNTRRSKRSRKTAYSECSGAADAMKMALDRKGMKSDTDALARLFEL